MQLVLDVVVAIASLVAVGQFTWAMRYHFEIDKVPLGVKLITSISFLACCLNLYLLFTREQPITVLVIGLMLALLSSALFTAAVRASRQARLRFVFEGELSKSILKAGPYRRIRHPFYASYLMLWAGWALATWSPLAALPLTALAVLYVMAARQEEQNFMASPLAAEYAAYRREAGFFWPVPRS